MPKDDVDRMLEIRLDDLQRESEGLVAFLKNRQPDDMSWNMMLRRRIQKMRDCVESIRF